MISPVSSRVAQPARAFSLLRAVVFALALGGLAFAAEAAPDAKQVRKSFDLPAGNALSTFRLFSAQSGAQLLYSAEEVENVTTRAAKGEFTAREALERILVGTPLSAVQDERTEVLTVRPKPTALPNEPSERSRPLSQAPKPGTMVGLVGNVATRSMLEGARVEIPALGRSVLTDNTGYFLLPDLPPGDHEVVVTYLGLDPARQTVQVPSGMRVNRNFDLSSTVYQLDAFVVAGEREGSAASITSQRNSPNLKNVLSLDAYGRMPNENVGELMIRLPGVAAVFDGEGNVFATSIRGTPPGLNSTSIDGNKAASSGGMVREFRTGSLTGAIFDEVEVVKASTPDMDADSLGGSVNLKTRSPLVLKEKRAFTYRAGARWSAPPFYDHIPMRREHPLQSFFSAGYQEVFDVFGGQRNLGVSFDAVYAGFVGGSYQTIQDYAYDTAAPSYVHDFRTQDSWSINTQRVGTLKTEYRLSATTNVLFTAIYNDQFGWADQFFVARAVTTAAGRLVAALNAAGQPTGAGAILPGYTDKITRVRAINTDFQLTSLINSFFTRERVARAGVKHGFDAWKIDYDAAYSRNHNNVGDDSRRSEFGGGTFTMNAGPIGWTLDKTDSEIYPRFTQTEGPSISNAASYRGGLLTRRNGNQRLTDLTTITGNVQYRLPTSFAASVKTGGRFRRHSVELVGRDHRWNYIGAAPLSIFDDPRMTSSEQRTGVDIPFVDTTLVTADIAANPARWREDGYYRESQRFIGSSRVIEDVTAGYLQGQARWGRLGVLAGVRREKTENDGRGFVPTRVQSTTAQRMADPAAAAQSDYRANQIYGSYTDTFPSVHLTYDLTKGLKARLSRSNGIGRPDFTNYVPRGTANLIAQTLTINNPNLQPQRADNWDLSLEYYFEPVGLISVGYFKKDIKDFIVRADVGIVASGLDNGFNGDYVGFTINSTFNGGMAKIEGWEIAYQQQFTFLPGVLKGLGAFANYTTLVAEGDYGGGTRLSTNQVANFVPQTANAGLNYKYRRFSGRALLNYTSGYLTAYSSDPSRLLFKAPRTAVNLNLGYALRPWATLFCDFNNLFQEPERWNRFNASRLGQINVIGTTMSFGVTGRF